MVSLNLSAFGRKQGRWMHQELRLVVENGVLLCGQPAQGTPQDIGRCFSSKIYLCVSPIVPCTAVGELST